MSLSFKVSFDLSDFEDDEFLHDLSKVYKFYKRKTKGNYNWWTSRRNKKTFL